MFFFVITKNSNWEISDKNLVTFKIWDGVKHERMKNINFFLRLSRVANTLKCVFTEKRLYLNSLVTN